MAFPIGAAIGAGAGLFSGVANGLFAGRTARINYNYGERAANNAHARQIEFWNMQNAYNTPTAERERLEDAGLNPALMYSNGAGASNAGQLSSVPVNPAAGSGLYNPGKLVPGDMMDSILKLAQVKNIEADTANKRSSNENISLQADLTRSVTDLTQSRVLGQDVKNNIDSLSLKLNEALFSTNVSQAEQTLRNSIQTYDKIIADTIGQMNKNALFGLEKSTMENYLSLQGQQIALTAVKVAAERAGISLTQAKISEIEQHISTMASQIRLNDQTLDMNSPAAAHASVKFWTDQAYKWALGGSAMVGSVGSLLGRGIGGLFKGKGATASGASRGDRVESIPKGWNPYDDLGSGF